MKTKKVEVIQNEEKPVSTQILAESIVSISNATNRLLNSGLNKRAIVVLVKDSSGVSMNEIERVLNALENLKKVYCK